MLTFNPEVDFKLLLCVPLIPLVGYVLQIALRKKLPWGDQLLTAGMAVSMFITVAMAAKAIAAAYAGETFFYESVDYGIGFHWLYSGNPEHTANVVAGVLYDPLGAAMLAVVGIVSFCVHLFSQGYMHGDKRYNIFFANISLFTFAMLGLVLSDNILFLFIFWEIMGLMSYLLIGHFSHDPSQPFFHRWATWASKKAFMTTRIGDVCLLVGILIFYLHFETLTFTGLWEAGKQEVASNGGVFPSWMTWAGLCVFGGTIGKSAQFPLHIWLPDAMAGPTPVSAMIHAATMVAAGVFLLGRMYPLMSPEALQVIIIVGGTTALFAATIGMVVYDLKAVLAYSTISQLGFMVTAVGLGGVTAGMFHMVTHAFFKACLFLSAGSVIHGCHHVQDMRLMGGLRKKMPITYVCMLICTLAISGVPFFSGFYSKDMIILAGWANVLDGTGFSTGPALYGLITLGIAAMFTAFYMCRMMFMTFSGTYRGNLKEHEFSAMLAAEGVEGPDPHEHHEDHGDDHGADHGADEHGDHGHDSHGHEPHESPLTIVIAISILAFFGFFGGHFWLTQPGHIVNFWYSTAWFQHLATPLTMYGSEVGSWVVGNMPLGVTDPDSDIAHKSHSWAVALSLTVAGLGIFAAVFLYGLNRRAHAAVVRMLSPVHGLVRNRYYIDEIIDATVLRPTMKLSLVLKAIDEKVVDGGVLLVGHVNKAGAFFSAWFDKTFVDGVVNAVGLVSQAFSAAFRLLQTGRIQQYAAFAVAGGLLTAAWLILS